MAKLAVDSGVWPLKEAAREGRVVHTVVPHRFEPIERYLRMQGRYQHLFEPVRRDDVVRQLQADVDGYWASVRAEGETHGDAVGAPER